MLRYVALTWDTDLPDQEDAARNLRCELTRLLPAWRPVLDHPGCYVVCIDEGRRASTCRQLERHTGVVLGTLFVGRGSEFSLGGPTLDPAESRRIMSTQGRELISSYWGSYVAILTDAAERKTWVLRAPMGNLPCFTAETRGLRLFFSRAADVVGLGSFSFSINWPYVMRRLVKLDRPEETGLNEISTVNGGDCCCIDRGGVSRETYWDPLAIARSGVIETIDHAVMEVRRMTKACLHAHASAYDRVGVLLSGGLDSSIVMSCLSSAPHRPRITGINQYSLNPECDEREFARAAARQAKCELVELPHELDVPVQDILRGLPTEKPQAYLMQVAQTRPIVAVARDLGHEVIFSGNGGDEIYGTDPVLSVADCAHMHGLTARLFKQAAGVALFNGLLIWKVLLQALAKGWSTYQWDVARQIRQSDTLVRWSRMDQALTEDSGNRFWFDKSRYVPPGKQAQMAFTLRHSNEATIPAFEQLGDPDRVDPLLSQPLVESCLRVPTYLAMNGGVERAVARRAFAGDVPPEILQRYWKGLQTGYSTELFRRNIDFMREILLKGQLVQLNMLHRSELEAALSGMPSKAMPSMVRLGSYISLETWLSTWAKYGARIEPDREISSRFATNAANFAEA